MNKHEQITIFVLDLLRNNARRSFFRKSPAFGRKSGIFNGAGQGKVHAAFSGHDPDLSVLGLPLPSDQQSGFMSFFNIFQYKTSLAKRSFLFRFLRI